MAIRSPFGGLLASPRGGLANECCCHECCGRELPDQPEPRVNPFPDVLFIRFTPINCPCLSTVTFAITWDDVDRVWLIRNQTIPGCNYPNVDIRVSCGGRVDGNDLLWSGVMDFWGPCVGGETSTGSDISFSPACASCDPVDCSVAVELHGISCCQIGAGSGSEESGTILIEIFE